MKRIVLSTSSSSLGHLKIPHEAGIIPMHIDFGDSHFVDDSQQIHPKMLNRMMIDNPKTTASTRPASKDEINETFANLYRHGYDEVFVCCLSSKFSQSYDLFLQQKSKYAGNMNIYVYDTKTLNLAEGALAYEADFLVRAGAPFSEVIQTLDDLRSRSLFSFTLESLNYIIRNKKLSAPAGFVANLFDIKPIMEITQDGYIVPQDKVRKFERAIRQMADHIYSQISSQEHYLYLADGTMGEMTDYCAQIIKDELQLKHLPIIPVSCISLANHGPTGLGLGAFYGKLPRIIQALPSA